MSKVRTVIQLEEDEREALRLESALSQKDMGEVVGELIREHLKQPLEQVLARKAAKAKKDKK